MAKLLIQDRRSVLIENLPTDVRSDGNMSSPTLALHRVNDWSIRLEEHINGTLYCVQVTAVSGPGVLMICALVETYTVRT